MMRQISANIRNATFFTIRADEAADVSNKEQLIICIWWVDECFVIHDDFIGMHPLERTNADQVVSNTKECPTENKLKHSARSVIMLQSPAENY